ncbi:MAG: ABC transporter permease [Lentisphaerota bacterium]
MRWRRIILPFILATGLGIALSTVLALITAQCSYLEGPGFISGLLHSPEVRSAIRLSLFCATVASFLALVIAVPAAYALSRWRFFGSSLVDALLDVPVIVSPIVIGISLILVFRSPPGQWVEEHLVRFIFGIPGIITAQFILALALEIRVLKAGFDEIDPRLEQVARFLGCTSWGCFRRVSLPLNRPAVLAALVLGWSRAIGDFGATVTIAGAMSGRTETIPTAIYMNLASVQIGKAVQLSLLLTVTSVAVLLALRLLNARRQP